VQEHDPCIVTLRYQRRWPASAQYPPICIASGPLDGHPLRRADQVDLARHDSGGRLEGSQAVLWL
jgi:hypothetical protein